MSRMTNLNYDDLVLSDVHLGSLRVRNKPSDPCNEDEHYVSRFLFKTSTYNDKDFNEKDTDAAMVTEDGIPPLAFDEDGDVIIRKRCQSATLDGFEAITIVHKMATPLADVGQQVWRGALLLADYMIHNQNIFKDQLCLEFGAGLGLCSIVAGLNARCVFCTDTGDAVLDMCQKNVEQNMHLLQNGSAVIKVRELNWLAEMKVQKHDEAFGWLSEDLESLKNVNIFLAADVIYDDRLTDGLFKTFLNLIENSDMHHHVLYIAVEKRLNFTIDDLDISCPAYKYFIRHLSELHGDAQMKENRSRQFSFTISLVDLDFPQYFDYSRLKELELWGIKCDTLLLDPSQHA